MNQQAFVSPALPWKKATPSSLTGGGLAHQRRLCPLKPSMNASPETNTDKPQASEQTQAAAEQPKTFGKPAGTLKSSVSWSQDFFPGFGSKGPGSRPTWDLRPKKMREPDTNGSIVCSNCNGTGLMTCSFCEGVTFKGPDGKDLPCPACGLEKYVTCTVCFGTGKQIELVRFTYISKIPFFIIVFVNSF